MIRVAAVDATFLISLMEAGLLIGASGTRLSEADVEGRLKLLVEDWSRWKTTLIIPAPAFAEALVRDPMRAARVNDVLRRASYVRLADFGGAAALECADLMRRILPRKSERSKVLTRSKLKFDLQILAIARVNNADVVYTADGQLQTRAKAEGMRAYTYGDLPKPAAHQPPLPLGSRESGPIGQAAEAPAPEDAGPGSPPGG